jgi:hypothetical protein
MIEKAVSKVAGEMTEETMNEETGLTVDRERCTRQPVLSAARNVKFLSSP